MRKKILVVDDDEGLRCLFVILHTSHPGYQEDFMSWAADAFIMKSPDLKELKGKVRELLERREPGSEATGRGTSSGV